MESRRDTYTHQLVRVWDCTKENSAFDEVGRDVLKHGACLMFGLEGIVHAELERDRIKWPFELLRRQDGANVNLRRPKARC